MNYSKRFRIEPGSKVDLNDIDPGFHGDHASHVEAAAELQDHLQRITKLQRALYADRSHSLLIVLQVIDGAGKDGTCCHVISAMAPQGVNVTGFKPPTEEERDHDFLWRVHPQRRDAAGSRSSTARTTRTCSSCACTSSRQRKSGSRATTLSMTGKGSSPSKTTRRF